MAEHVPDPPVVTWSVEWTEVNHMYMGVWVSSTGGIVADCHLFVTPPGGAVKDWRWSVNTGSAQLVGWGHGSREEVMLFCGKVSEAYWRARAAEAGRK